MHFLAPGHYDSYVKVHVSRLQGLTLKRQQLQESFVVLDKMPLMS